MEAGSWGSEDIPGRNSSVRIGTGNRKFLLTVFFRLPLAILSRPSRELERKYSELLDNIPKNYNDSHS